jgi:hypothetical protein
MPIPSKNNFLEGIGIHFFVLLLLFSILNINL